MGRNVLDRRGVSRLRRKEPEVSDRLASTWWDENGSVQLQRNLVNPWRLRYFNQVLLLHFDRKLPNNNVLVIGCGAGVLAEGLSLLRCSIYGIDSSSELIHMASHRAQALELPPQYQRGALNRLPFPDETFNVVAITDTLEHISDWEPVLSEAHRVLAPGGVFLFSTINRTFKSYVQIILTAEKFPLTRILPKSTHSWKKFIRPTELKQALSDYGFVQQEIVGSAIEQSLPYVLSQIIKLKNLTISAHQFGRRIQFKPSFSVGVNYMGSAIKG